MEEEDIAPEVLAELVAKHGQPLRALKTVAGTVVIRLVNQKTFRTFREMTFDKKSQSDASTYLAQNACVWPDRPTMQAMIGKYPGIAIKMANCAAKMVGFDLEDDEGKEIGG